MMRILMAALACGAALALPAQARAAGMNNGWENITMTQDQCVTAAATAVERAGFQMQRDANGAWGYRTHDGVTIRCVAQRQLAMFFIYVGQGGAPEARALHDQLRNAFNAASPPRTTPAR